jgi:hypothetical protein
MRRNLVETVEAFEKRKKMREQGDWKKIQLDNAIDLIKNWDKRDPQYKYIKPETCDIVKAHHQLMQDDPERMPTNFIKNILGKTCPVTDPELLAEHEQFMKTQKKYGRFVDPEEEFRKKKSSKSTSRKPKKIVRKCKCKK